MGSETIASCIAFYLREFGLSPPFILIYDLIWSRSVCSSWHILTAMISKVKNAMSTLVGGIMPHGHHHHHQHGSGNVQNCGLDGLPPRFPYSRPEFLDLTPELLQYSTEHASRPVITPKRDSRLPWRTGYAEWVVNLTSSVYCPTKYTDTQQKFWTIKTKQQFWSFREILRTAIHGIVVHTKRNVGYVWERTGINVLYACVWNAPLTVCSEERRQLQYSP